MATSLAQLFGAVFPAKENTTTRSGEYGPTFGFVGSPVASVGTFVFNAEADVRSGTQFGAGGTEFTGTLQDAGSVPLPDITEVLSGVGYGEGLVGIRMDAAESVVLAGYQYGANGSLVGQLSVPAGGLPSNNLYAGVRSTKTETIICNQDISAKTIQVVFETRKDAADVALVADNELQKSATDVTFALPEETTVNDWTLRVSVRDTTTNEVYGTGLLHVFPIAIAE